MVAAARAHTDAPVAIATQRVQRIGDEVEHHLLDLRRVRHDGRWAGLGVNLDADQLARDARGDNRVDLVLGPADAPRSQGDPVRYEAVGLEAIDLRVTRAYLGAQLRLPQDAQRRGVHWPLHVNDGATLAVGASARDEIRVPLLLGFNDFDLPAQAPRFH